MSTQVSCDTHEKIKSLNASGNLRYVSLWWCCNKSCHDKNATKNVYVYVSLLLNLCPLCFRELMCPPLWICSYLHHAAWSCVTDVSFMFVWLAEPGVKVSSELVASVQSLVAVLQQQIDTSSHQDATHTLEARQAHSLPQDNVIHFFFVWHLLFITDLCEWEPCLKIFSMPLMAIYMM